MRSIFLLSLLAVPLLAQQPRVSSIGSARPSPATQSIPADLDQDGDMDLVVRGNDGEHFWYENLGDLTFSEPRILSTTNSQSTNDSALTSDKLGRYFLISVERVVGRPASENRFRVYLTRIDAKGNLSQPQQLVSGLTKPPLLVSLDADESIQIILQDGEFPVVMKVDDFGQLVQWSDAPLTSLSVLTDNRWSEASSADLDGDGDLDLIITNDSSRSYLLERTGPKKFEGQVFTGLNGLVEPYDLDGDGTVDLLHSSRLSDNLWTTHTGNFDFITKTFRRDGNQPLHPARTASSDTAPWVGTEKNDSDEFSITEFKIENGGNLTAQQSGPFQVSSAAPSSRPLSILTSLDDLDGDGQAELIVIASAQEDPPVVAIPVNRSTFPQSRLATHLTIFKKGELGYQPTERNTQTFGVNYHSIVTGDFNNDGNIDVLVGEDADGNFQVYFNDGLANFSKSDEVLRLYSPDRTREQFGITGLKTVDFNGDGHLDLAMTFVEKTSVGVIDPNQLLRAACTVIQGNGDGTFTEVMVEENDFELSRLGYCEISSFVDWDGDGDLDAILEGSWLENIDDVLSRDRRPLISNQLVPDPFGHPVRPTGHLVGDVDGDGYPDYITPGYEIGPLFGLGGNGAALRSHLGVAFNDGQGGIASVQTHQSNLLAYGILGNFITYLPIIADLNEDGQPELLHPELTSNAIGHLLIAGTRWLRIPAETPRDWTNVFAQTFSGVALFDGRLRDFDGNGTLEYVGPESFITPDPSGPTASPTFDFRQGLNLPDFHTPVAMDDFDGDGDADTLYFGNIFRSSPRIFIVKNLIIDERSTVRKSLIEAGVSGQLAVPEADADGDGRSNALEFLEATSPTLADDAEPMALTPVWSVEGNQISFPRRKDAAELQLFYDLEGGDDLTNWKPFEVAIDSTESIDETWELVTVTISLDDQVRFYRVRASHDPGR